MEFARKNSFLNDKIYKAGFKRTSWMYDRIDSYLKKGDQILDIGSGTCNLVEILRTMRFNVTPLDIIDLSFVPGIKPTIYDGIVIPFEDNQFDLSLLITVLHHTPDPERLLLEAKRVSKRLVVIEDVYTTAVQKYLTYAMDNISNFEIFVNPHSNKDDVGWKHTFNKLGFKLKDVKQVPFWGIFLSATYYLEK
ncbi:hypothetical protein A2714_04280 [Candidatus Woesebacteria bacterium RIFCSPHIGHO2_01_FULL_38_9]|uniref:Methyltransferase type 11 domain-containing protein n=2 Tax=Candidatus Woeseibacteriota TaxID=1752722 RepID=A0A1F7XYA3_9BACT|nr:MAG: hypothetical protein A2714_04280 [Candidatus Woesebacteria bacterium RIFCSPHIGHO2_01_FULL_38_9]OGM58987.1 MAG: hypothetical protein A3A75_00445 [Candidatus Woesebacteria bacterium RIFCSPLOWO2_01_FULL_39_10]